MELYTYIHYTHIYIYIYAYIYAVNGNTPVYFCHISCKIPLILIKFGM